MLLEVEARPQYSPCSNYLTSSDVESTGSKETITDDGRCKICEWCYSVVDHFDVDREVVSIAMNYLDRHAAKRSKANGGSSIPHQEFQLISVTSLFLAAKLHGEISFGKDGRRTRLPIGVLAQLTNGKFSVETIEASERDLLYSLDWFTHPSSAINFVRIMVNLIPERHSSGRRLIHPMALEELFEIARYLTELAACAGYISINFKPSVIAFAALLCTIEELDGKVLALSHKVRMQFLANVKAATKLFPAMDEVEAVREKLAATLSQSATACKRIPTENKRGMMSPVCVVHEMTTEKKRRRVPVG